MKKILDFAGLLFHLVLILGVGVVAYGAVVSLLSIANVEGTWHWGKLLIYAIFFGGAILMSMMLLFLFGALVYQFYFKSKNICPDCYGKNELGESVEIKKCEKCGGTGTFRAWKQTIDNSAPDKVQVPWWT
ncbi:hypothetical protein HZB94_03170 [Candidatus Falkowbacteria bacterium]|nr:hypothetical protein [Candidatus Falkowbacteria bacterium]